MGRCEWTQIQQLNNGLIRTRKKQETGCWHKWRDALWQTYNGQSKIILGNHFQNKTKHTQQENRENNQDLFWQSHNNHNTTKIRAKKYQHMNTSIVSNSSFHSIFLFTFFYGRKIFLFPKRTEFSVNCIEHCPLVAVELLLYRSLKY